MTEFVENAFIAFSGASPAVVFAASYVVSLLVAFACVGIRLACKKKTSRVGCDMDVGAACMQGDRVICIVPCYRPRGVLTQASVGGGFVAALPTLHGSVQPGDELAKPDKRSLYGVDLV